MGVGGKDGLIDSPQAHGGLVRFLLHAGLHPSLGHARKAARPGGQSVDSVTGCAVRRIEHVRRIEQPGGRLLPQIPMPRQAQIKHAEGGHQGRVMPGEEVRVFAEMGIGGRQMLGIVISRSGRGALRVLHQGRLQLVGNHAQFVAAHVQQHVNPRLHAHLERAWRRTRRK